MPDIIAYLLKVNLAIVLFYLGYRLLLRKLTFYTLNRFYLLFALAFSAGYPLVDLTGWLAAKRGALPGELDYALVNWHHVPADSFGWWPYVSILFWVGAVYFLSRLLVRLGSVWRIHRQSQPAIWRLFRYRQVFGEIMPFSFWRNIYLNIHRHDGDELVKIFEHERIHVSGLHTTDVLLAELCSVFCWFNPGAWLIRHAIHENLEFVTDRRVLRSGVDRKAYQYSLLKAGQYAAGNPALANSFNFKSLKRRIMMMNKHGSSRLQLGKYVFAVPGIALFVSVFTVSKAYYSGDAHPMAGDTTRIIAGAVTDAADALSLDSVEHESPGPLRPDTLKRKAAENMGNRVAFPAAGDLEAPTDSTVSLELDIPNTTKPQENVSSEFRLGRPDVQPLFVIDGKEAGAEDLKTLSPNDIEAINVWKGRSGVEKYGEKGRNGVVEITMKKRGGKQE